MRAVHRCVFVCVCVCVCNLLAMLVQNARKGYRIASVGLLVVCALCFDSEFVRLFLR